MVFLVGCAAPATVPAESLWHTIEPNLVRDWCPRGAMPLAEPVTGWADCSAVTLEDAKRLGVHKRLVEENR